MPCSENVFGRLAIKSIVSKFHSYDPRVSLAMYETTAQIGRGGHRARILSCPQKGAPWPA